MDPEPAILSERAGAWIDYEYCLIRLVPRVHLAEGVNVGVVLHARAAAFLGLRIHLEPEAWAACFPGLDVEMAVRALEAWRAIAEGGASAGPIGLLPHGERFHWLSAPRSAVLQCSAVRGGRSLDPVATLDALFAASVSPRS
jgi:hypothetical protein